VLARLAARLAERPVRRIAVVQTAFLGDTVFTSALVGGLRARFPDAELDLCVAPRGRDVAMAIEGVGCVIVFDKYGADRGVTGALRAARRLRERGYDLAVLPHRSLRTGVVARAARIPIRVGFEGTAAGLFCTDRVRDEGLTFLEREAGLVRALGGQSAPIKLSPTAEQRAQAETALDKLGLRGARIAALSPGSEWQTKMWPAERYADLARALDARGLRPLLLGSPREVALADAIRAQAGVPVASAAGNSVGESLGLLSRASLAVGGDSGLLHAARALGVPTVMLFGPTAPEAHVWEPSSRVVNLRLDCSPCSDHGQRRCPLGHHRCLRDLGVERVLDAAAALGATATLGVAR
jgi:heptosyltransferase-2